MKLPAEKVEGVSPVIGIILLVALTVMLSAVVVAVGLGFVGGNISSKHVGLVLDTYTTSSGTSGSSEHGIVVTLMNGEDTSDLVAMYAYMDGPELYYRQTGNTDVADPILGVPYHYFVSTGTSLKLYDSTWVQTIDYNNTGTLSDKLVTIVGKFSDGTEQILLQKYVTIPAIPGAAQNTTSNYVSLVPYTNTTGIPGHGLIGTIINTSSVKSLGKIVLDVHDSSGRPLSSTYSTLSPGDSAGSGSYFYHLTSGNVVKESPYYVFSGTEADPTEELIGTATITLTLQDKTTVTETFTVTIPARINIFENSSIASGVLQPTTTSNKIANLTFTAFPPTTTKIAYGLRDSYQALGYITGTSLHGSDYVYELGNGVKGSITYLQNYPTDTLEVYVLTSNTIPIWYRVASIPVADLLP